MFNESENSPTTAEFFSQLDDGEFVAVDRISDIPNSTSCEEVQNEIAIAVVTNCKKLNVREKPDANSPVITAIPINTEVMIETAYSTDTFYKVFTAIGIEGYCMKQYIEILE